MRSSLKKFRIKSRESDLWFWVYVYGYIEDLRDDVIEHGSRYGGGSDNDNEVLGICHVYERFRIEPDKPERRLDNIGLIRLADGYLTSDIVTHELIHASMWLYRLEWGVDREFEGSSCNADFGNANSEDEERFAHIYGQLFRDLNMKLHKHKFWY